MKRDFLLSEFEHFLITRFNVKSQAGFDNIPPPKGLDASKNAGYLQYRFSLFDRYCYPSVRSQSSQNFKWLVFFDGLTPEVFREKINQYCEWKEFKPVFAERFDEHTVCESVKKHMAGNPSHIITTRLDNDDGIARDYIELIQRNFVKKNNLILNFNWGYYLKHPEGKLYLRGRCVNPFASLIEEEKSFRTIFFFDSLPHHKLKLKYQPKGLLRNIELEAKRPAWLVVFHGQNIANSSDIKNGFRQHRNKIQAYFSVWTTEESKYEPPIFILIDQMLWRICHHHVVMMIQKWMGEFRFFFGKYRRLLLTCKKQ